MPLTTLPPEYNTHKVISLRKGKPHAKWVYSLNLLVFLVAVWLMSRFIPFLTMFEKVNESYIISVPRFILNLVMTTFILLCYAIVHLLLKGLFCKLLGGAAPKFGIKGWYYYVGSQAYMSKGKYVLFVLFPELVLFALLTLLCLLLPLRFFWLVYLVQAFHLARFSASLYLIFLVLKQPGTAFFRNMGTLTMIYIKS